ncbi:MULTISPECIES: hypothetical protein [Gimesia]|uniref:hypothetical protein n=1 Tax=Gimesia TaxID=1649453 RepID=UPI001E3ED9BA|nr:hypothetical protein [Gimesia chilikensis]
MAETQGVFPTLLSLLIDTFIALVIRTEARIISGYFRDLLGFLLLFTSPPFSSINRS